MERARLAFEAIASSLEEEKTRLESELAASRAHAAALQQQLADADAAHAARERTLLDANAALLNRVDELSTTVADLQAQALKLTRRANDVLVGGGAGVAAAAGSGSTPTPRPAYSAPASASTTTFPPPSATAAAADASVSAVLQRLDGGVADLRSAATRDLQAYTARLAASLTGAVAATPARARTSDSNGVAEWSSYGLGGENDDDAAGAAGAAATSGGSSGDGRSGSGQQQRRGASPHDGTSTAQPGQRMVISPVMQQAAAASAAVSQVQLDPRTVAKAGKDKQLTGERAARPYEQQPSGDPLVVDSGALPAPPTATYASRGSSVGGGRGTVTSTSTATPLPRPPPPLSSSLQQRRLPAGGRGITAAMPQQQQQQQPSTASIAAAQQPLPRSHTAAAASAARGNASSTPVAAITPGEFITAIKAELPPASVARLLGALSLFRDGALSKSELIHTAREALTAPAPHAVGAIAAHDAQAMQRRRGLLVAFQTLMGGGSSADV